MSTYSEALIDALQKTDVYDYPVEKVSLIETHVSWILLTGLYAYKIKKPVDFGFLDFSTLEKRRFYCAEELRLNRRYAPGVYLDVVTISGDPSHPRLNAAGQAIEYAVKMVQFSQDEIMSRYARERQLKAAHIDAIADAVAGFHSSAQVSDASTEFGTAATIIKWSAENLVHIDHAAPAHVLPAYYAGLKTWCEMRHRDLADAMTARLVAGFVRECHGDLHLGNIAFLHGEIVPFDCIEFNPELRWTDTSSDIAFVAMDLQANGYAHFASRFINQYLQVSGDYASLGLLRFYLVYRALVRAKVEALSVTPLEIENQGVAAAYAKVRHYLDLAHDWSRPEHPVILIMHGLSGSGKSTVAMQVVERCGAIRIRSDVERKRVFGLQASADSESATDQGIYTAEATRLTYQRLRELAVTVNTSGYSAVIDATFLQSTQRDQFRRLASRLGVAFIVISCDVDEIVLRQRIHRRSANNEDPSEADQVTLTRQLLTQEPILDAERMLNATLVCDENGLSEEQLREISKQMGRVAG